MSAATLTAVRAALIGVGCRPLLGGDHIHDAAHPDCQYCMQPLRCVLTQEEVGTASVARRDAYDMHDVIGVELTRADFSMGCVIARHIDPQGHTGGPPHRVDVYGDRGHWDDHTHTPDGRPESAASFAMGLASRATTYVVGRPDLDSIATIAVLEILDVCPAARARVEAMIAPRVEQIRAADCHRDRGPWAPYPLDAEHMWPPSGAVQDTASLGPIASICSPMGSDPVLPLAERVAIVAEWLLTGEEIGPVAEARRRIESERAAMIARHEGMIEVRDHGGAHRVAIVVSNEQGAIGIGYSLAPIVVAYAPAYRWPSGAVTPKITIASWDASYLDHAALREHLGEGWGGPRDGTITGSPMGRAPVARCWPSGARIDRPAGHENLDWVVAGVQLLLSETRADVRPVGGTQ